MIGWLRGQVAGLSGGTASAVGLARITRVAVGPTTVGDRSGVDVERGRAVGVVVRGAGVGAMRKAKVADGDGIGSIDRGRVAVGLGAAVGLEGSAVADTIGAVSVAFGSVAGEAQATRQAVAIAIPISARTGHPAGDPASDCVRRFPSRS